MHPAALPEDRLLAECETQRLRRSGPGGQHRNKVETAIHLTHLPTGVSAEANERRSQSENHQRAVFRLRVQLAMRVRSPVSLDPEPLRPSELWQSRCREGKVTVNPGHRDFPVLLAEAFDMLNTYNWDPAAAAQTLGCSTSQLIKLLRLEPHALVIVNRQRADLGRHPLN